MYSQTYIRKVVESRKPKSTVGFIDEYCQYYRNQFSDVRSFEDFKYLHMGSISDIKRKILPEIAKVVGLDNHQILHHLLTHSPWNSQNLRKQRLDLILKVLALHKFGMN